MRRIVAILFGLLAMGPAIAQVGGSGLQGPTTSNPVAPARLSPGNLPLGVLSSAGQTLLDTTNAVLIAKSGYATNTGVTSPSAQNAANSWMYFASSLSGVQSLPSGFYPLWINVPDTLDWAASSQADGILGYNAHLQSGWNGAGFVLAGLSTVVNNAPITIFSRGVGAFNSSTAINSSLGGTDLNYADAIGGGFGGGDFEISGTANYTYGEGGTAHEFDVAFTNNVLSRIGANAVAVSGFNGEGVYQDCAFCVGNQGSAATFWRGLEIGSAISVWPLDATSDIVHVTPRWVGTSTIGLTNAANAGEDYRAVNFATAAHLSRGNMVGPAGDQYAKSLVLLNGNITQQSASLASITINADRAGITGGSYFGNSAFPTLQIQTSDGGGTNAAATVATMALTKALITNIGVGGANGDTLTLTGDTGTEPTLTLNVSSFTASVTNAGFGLSTFGDTLNVPGSVTGAALAAGMILSDSGVNVPGYFSASCSIAALVMTCGAPASGTIQIGAAISGSGINSDTYITSRGTGTGGAGTYNVNVSQTISSETVTAAPVYIVAGSGTTWKLNRSIPAIVSQSMTAVGVTIAGAGSITAKAANETTTGGSSSPQPTFNFGWGIATITVGTPGTLYACNPPPLVAAAPQSNTRSIIANLTAVMSCTAATHPPIVVNTGLPVAAPGSGFMDATGQLIIGQNPPGSVFLSSSTAGSAITITCNTACFTGTAAGDTGRQFVFYDGGTPKTFAVTSNSGSSTTIAQGTLNQTLTTACTSGSPCAAANIYESGPLSTATNAVANGTTYSAPPPASYPWIVFNLPSSAASGAGQFYCSETSPNLTLFQCFNVKYTSGQPSIPLSPAAFTGLTPGTYTQTTGTALAALSIAIPGNSLGANGKLSVTFAAVNNNSASTKSFTTTYGNLLISGVNPTTTTGNGLTIIMRNAGATNVQTASNQFVGSSSVFNVNHISVDSTVNKNLIITENLLTVATDFALIDGITVEVALN